MNSGIGPMVKSQSSIPLYAIILILCLIAIIGGYFLSKKYPLNTNELKAIFDKEDGESNDITEPSGDIGNSYAAIDSSGVENGEHGHYATPLSQVNKHNIDEVFHVAGELVDYDTADQVCKQYGARLASYDELLHAYQHGAEWCNYGWSQNQTAYYPTQKKTWERLQYGKTELEKTMCGVPGLNGGRFKKNMKFNVNCFGKRPDKPDTDFVHPKLPKKPTKEQSKEELKHFDDLVVIPYNRKRWSRKDYEPHPV